MTVPAWHVINWSTVPIATRAFRDAYGRFTHLGTNISEESPQQRCGQALWGLRVGSQVVGIAFEWAEAARGVPVLADPMQILSNVTLLDDDGRPLNDAARIVELNTAVHEIDWQQQLADKRQSTLQRLAA